MPGPWIPFVATALSLCPVEGPNTPVEVRLRSGEHNTSPARHFIWRETGQGTITSYRLLYASNEGVLPLRETAKSALRCLIAMEVYVAEINKEYINTVITNLTSSLANS